MPRIYPLICGFGHAFLIEDAQGLSLIDSGSPGQENVVLRKMRQLGRSDLKLIWITHAHYDHYGSAAALRTLTGAQIGVHSADASSLSLGQSPLGTTRHQGFIFALVLPLLERIWPLPATSPDFTLEDGETLERFGLHASVHHTPGHTPGHTCILLPDGTAFAGDLIGRSPWLGLQCLVATDWSQLPVSLRRFQASHPQRIYTGHSSRPITAKMLQAIKPRTGQS